MRWGKVTFVLFLTVLGAGCGKQATSVDRATASLIETVPADRWKDLASRRIFFAHKSVGYNVVEGVSALALANPQIGVRLIETRSPDDFERPVFAHAENGLNGDPSGKLAGFRKAIDSGIGAKVDLAFLKFCWSDFTPDTNITELFAEYKATMARLRAEYPRTTFIHVTVPLTIVQSGPKAWAKRLLGRPIFGSAENVVRNQFNELLRSEYDGKEPVFDLAAWESTMPDGSENQYTADDGRAYRELIGEYASDGGHLNPEGQQWVAAHLLVFLASLPSNYTSQ